jgi:hypothetical protein
MSTIFLMSGKWFDNNKSTSQEGNRYDRETHRGKAVERAKEACANSVQAVADHFEDILGMVGIGSGAICASHEHVARTWLKNRKK